MSEETARRTRNPGLDNRLAGVESRGLNQNCVFFLISLLLFYVSQHKNERQTAIDNPVLHVEGIAVENSSNNNTPLDIISLFLLMLGSWANVRCH
jgi:hypothetical protein